MKLLKDNRWQNEKKTEEKDNNKKKREKEYTKESIVKEKALAKSQKIREINKGEENKKILKGPNKKGENLKRPNLWSTPQRRKNKEIKSRQINREVNTRPVFNIFC